MSHVDEGILHACLDGALDALSDAGELPGGATAADVMEHLRTCADCRARLEAERSIREGAGAVLHDARLTHIDVPPFAEIPRTRDTRRGRWLPLGWAASILLAVGAGWWGSEAWRAPAGSGDRAPQEAVSSAQPEAAPSARASMDAMEATDDAPADRTAGAGTDAAAARTEQTAAEVAIDAPHPDSPRVSVAAADPRTGASPASASLPAPPAIPPASPPAIARAAPLRVTGIDTSAGRAQVIGSNPAMASSDAILRESAGRTFSFQRGDSFVRTDSMLASTAASASAPALKQMFVPVIAPPAGFDSTIAREQSGRIAFTAASAEDRRQVEGQIFVVDDASAPAIVLARAGGETTVRLSQTLRSGERVELVAWRSDPAAATAMRAESATMQSAEAATTQRAAAAAPATEAATPMDETARRAGLIALPAVRRLRDGRNEIVLRDVSASVWIALRADLGAEELRDLAARLRRLPPQP